MITKEKLERISELTVSIRHKEARCDALAAAVTGSALSYSERVQTSASNLKEAIVVNLADLRSEIEQEKAELEPLQEEVRAWAKTLTCTEARIIELRYCDLMRWDDVAASLAYSTRQTRRIHDDLIRKLDENQGA